MCKGNDDPLEPLFGRSGEKRQVTHVLRVLVCIGQRRSLTPANGCNGVVFFGILILLTARAAEQAPKTLCPFRFLGGQFRGEGNASFLVKLQPCGVIFHRDFCEMYRRGMGLRVCFRPTRKTRMVQTLPSINCEQPTNSIVHLK